MKSRKPIDKPDHISILLPTRGRPSCLQRLFDSLQQHTRQKELVDVWLYVDEDDRPTRDFLEGDRLRRCGLETRWIIGRRTVNMGEMLNTLWRESTTNAGIYLPMTDDYLFATPGWDLIARQTFRAFPDRLVLGYLDEPTAAPGQALMFILSAQWINLFGRILTNYFPFWFDDTWLDQVSQMVGRRVKLGIRMEPQGGKGKTRRMRNLPFWHRFYIHTIDERLQDAEVLRSAIFGTDSTACRDNRSKGLHMARHFQAKMHANDNFAHLDRQEKMFRDAADLASPGSDRRYRLSEEQAIGVLLQKVEAFMAARRYRLALPILDTLQLASQKVAGLDLKRKVCRQAMERSANAADATQALAAPRPVSIEAQGRAADAADTLIAPEIKNDRFYAEIKKLAASADIRSILEIGASSGQGSTEALFLGAQHNPQKPFLHCIEISAKRFAALEARYGDQPWVICHRASSVSLADFPEASRVRHFYRNTPTALNRYPLDQVLGWLQADTAYLKAADVAQNGIQAIKRAHGINTFDMVLIDGSEFTGQAELKQVYGARYILLDDINSFKNYDNYQLLKNDHGYALVSEDWTLRNGYAIFRRLDDGKVLPLHIFTLVLNGEPFIRHHLEVFSRLKMPWHWHIIEGVADLKHDTAWSLPAGGRIGDEFHLHGLSIDGTSAYLDDIARRYPRNITLYRTAPGRFWDGKLDMITAPLANLPDDCLLLQIDADELWTDAQLRHLHALFAAAPAHTAAYFHCHFFVGPQLVTTTPNAYSHHDAYEWLRAWRFRKGMRWHSHEPPQLMTRIHGRWQDVAGIRAFTHDQTEAAGLVFSHYAYALESQVRFKEAYYGYRGAVQQWRRLQQAPQLPLALGQYLKWVKDGAQADHVSRRTIGKAVAPVPWSFDRTSHQARAEHMRIVIDGVIFQLQHGRPLGIARVWQNLLAHLGRVLPQAHITVLERRGFAVPEERRMERRVIQPYDWHSEAALDADDEQLRDICAELRADIFISTYYTRAPGCANIVLVHDLIAEKLDMDLTRPEWQSKRRALETADAFAAVSQATYNDLQRIYPFTVKRPTAIVPNGLSAMFKPAGPQLTAQWRKAEQITSPYLLMVGNRHGYKNSAALFEVVDRPQWDRRLQVVCVGGEAARTALEERLVQKGRLRFMTRLDDSALVAAYSGACALVTLSRDEGFGLPVLEAMACGCPVIASAQGALPEVGGDAALYAEPGAEDQLLNAIRKVQDHKAREELIHRGLQRTRQFSWSRTAAKLSGLIRTVFQLPPVQVSAIVSTFNSRRFIRGCLEDLQAQTIADSLEIIVVDSGSQQDEAFVVRDFQLRCGNIKYLRTSRREPVYAAWNRGIKFARGRYITSANTDDRHRRDALERMTAVLEDDESVVLVFADVIKTATENERFDQCKPTGILRWHDWNRQKLLDKGCFMGPQPMWRRSVHHWFGFFNDAHTISGDYEFWLRISQTFDFKHLAVPLGLYLERPDSLEHAHDSQKRAQDQAVNQLYRRARQEGRILDFIPFEMLKRSAGSTAPHHLMKAREALRRIAVLACRLSSGRAQTVEDGCALLLSNLEKGALEAGLLDQFLHQTGYWFLSRGWDKSSNARRSTPNRQDPLGRHDNPERVQAGSFIQGGLIMQFARQFHRGLHCLLDSGHDEMAQWVLEKYLLDHKDDAQAHQAYAMLAHTQGKVEPALHHLQKAAELAQGNADYQKSLGDFYNVVQGNAQAAIEQYHKALALRPDHVETLMTVAHLYLSQRQFENARVYYRKVLHLHPDHDEARQFLDKLDHQGTSNSAFPAAHAGLPSAEREVGHDHHGDAIRELEAAIRVDPNQAAPHNDLGVLYYECGEKQKALQHYERAADLAPENAVFQKNLADFYYVESGDIQKALQKYVQALTLNPQDVECLLATGHICLAMKQFEDARVFLQRILEIDPTHPEAQNMFALLESGVSKPMAPADEEELYAQAQAKAAAQDGAGAIALLKQLICQNPDHALAYNDLGVLCYNQGDKAEAVRCYEQAVRLEPQNRTFQKNLADFYLIEQGRIQEALKIYVSVLEQDRQDVDCLMAAGTICARLGNSEDARIFYNRIIEIEPWHVQAREALAQLDNQQPGAVVVDFTRQAAL